MTTEKTDKVLKYPFWLGGAGSSIAACFTHPLDFLKVRLQTAQQRGNVGLFSTIGNIAKKEGVLTFYNGLSAALLRQMSYSTVRFGCYENVTKPYAQSVYGEQPLPLWAKVAASGSAGAVGGVVGNAADVSNVRMQSDRGAVPRYRHVGHALTTIVREEGVAALFSGVLPNTVRAVLMTSAQLATYDQLKELLLRTGLPLGFTTIRLRDNLKEDFAMSCLTHFICGLGAGFVATVTTAPVDVVKTRLMSAAPGTYNGILDCISSMARSNGPLVFFRGFFPAWVRLGPHTVVTFVALEQLRSIVGPLS